MEKLVRIVPTPLNVIVGPGALQHWLVQYAQVAPNVVRKLDDLGAQEDVALASFAFVVPRRHRCPVKVDPFF